MFDRHRQRTVVLFAAADVILTALAFEAAYQTREAVDLPRVFFLTPPIKALLLGFILALWLLLGRWFGVYRRLYAGDIGSAAWDALRQVFFGALGLAMFMFVLRLDISRPFIAVFLAYNLILLISYRALTGRLRGWVRRQFGAEFFYIVVGSGRRAIDLARRIEEFAEYGVRLLAFVDLSGETEGELKLKRSYPVSKLEDIPAMLRDGVVDEILFGVEASRLPGLEEIFLLCDEQGVRTRVAADFFPHVNSRIFLDRFGDLPMLTFSATPHDEIRLLLKRIFDLVFAALSLAVLAIPMLVVGALIRLSSKGPAIFHQVRCGLSGRRFRFYKFRSMRADAESLRPALERLNQKDGPAFKIIDDPRVTRLGRFLRRYSIDEWPQFWNIFKGDMSFVGPRPAVPSEVKQYKTWQRRRLCMRPGLTCLWAIRGRDEVKFEEWMKMDLEYIDNWSLDLDFKILLRSIPKVLTGKGAH